MMTNIPALKKSPSAQVLLLASPRTDYCCPRHRLGLATKTPDGDDQGAVKVP